MAASQNIPQGVARQLAALSMRAENLMQSNSPREALPVYRQLVERISAAFGPSHPDTLAGFNNLALVLHSLENYAEAELLLTRAYEGKVRVLGASDPDTVDTARNLADVYFDQGKCHEAAPLLRGVIDWHEEQGTNPENPELALVKEHYMEALLQSGEVVKALPFLQASLHAKRRRLGDSAPDTLAALHRLVSLLRQVGRRDEAEAISALVNPPPSSLTNIVRTMSGRNLRTNPLSSATAAAAGGGGGGSGGGGGGGASAVQPPASMRWGSSFKLVGSGGAGGGGGGGGEGATSSLSHLVNNPLAGGGSSLGYGGAGAQVHQHEEGSSYQQEHHPDTALSLPGSAPPTSTQEDGGKWDMHCDAESVWFTRVGNPDEAVWVLPDGGEVVSHTDYRV